MIQSVAPFVPVEEPRPSKRRRPRKPPVTGVMRDTQCARVYEWGRLLIEKAPRRMDLDEIRAVVKRIADEYDERCPNVYDGRARRSGCFDGDIHLPRFARSLEYVLHEMAHCIARYARQAAHGPIFARVHYDLLVRYGPWSASEAKALARKCRVKFAKVVDAPVRSYSTAEVRTMKRLTDAISKLVAERGVIEDRARMRRRASRYIS